MQVINDIKIVSIDTERPPRVRKEAYIDVFFTLAVKAPSDWCEDFNALGRKMDPSVKIDKDNGLCIEAWVKHMDHIQPQLDRIKQKIKLCNQQYIEKALARAQALADSANSSLEGQSKEQNKLNSIVAALNFDG